MIVRDFILIFLLTSPVTALAAGGEADPFAGVMPKNESQSDDSPKGFFSDNFGFRKELMSEFGTNDSGYASSRQSLGMETLKKLSTDTKTFAAVDFQGRVVRRDGYLGSINDMEGMNRHGWAFEYHNAYADFYNLLDPILSDEQKSLQIGRFNARVGHFYVPFGLNLQTDTHGTILQLSNERNFGFERDWYVGFWGNLSEDLRYDLNYLLGSGYEPKFKGQSGLVTARLSLAGKYLSEDGLEGGLSFMDGRRLTTSGEMSTLRVGIDGRFRRNVPTGLLTWTTELTGGRDALDPLVTQLHQLDYLHASRRWGVATQYRWFWQGHLAQPTDSSFLAELTWYFRNDVAGSNLHWIKINWERQLARQKGSTDVIWTLQYYMYI